MAGDDYPAGTKPHQRISTKLEKFRPSLTLGLRTLVQERASRGLLARLDQLAGRLIEVPV